MATNRRSRPSAAFLLLVFAFAFAGCATRPPERPPERGTPAAEAPPSGQEIWAYNAHWMGEAWRVYDLRAFRRLLFFDLAAGADGAIESRNGWPERWEGLRRAAREARVPLDPVVSVIGNDTFAAIFRNPERRARLLQETTALARNAEGVHLDVEILGNAGDAELRGFAAFLGELRNALEVPPRKMLSAFVPGGTNIYGPRELSFLDVAVVQGYDVHWKDSPQSGPIALLNGASPAAWQPAADALARSGVSPRKMVFSTPLYGYEWPTDSDSPGAPTTGPGIITTFAPLPRSLSPELRVNALARAAAHGLRRDGASAAPWYAFRDRAGWRQGWYDDALSLKPRLDFVRAGNYRGVALFVLGYDGGTLLEAIEDAFR
ncbi:MAG: glycosyl hydrolase family 18 protein [Bacillota bacterium]